MSKKTPKTDEPKITDWFEATTSTKRAVLLAALGIIIVLALFTTSLAIFTIRYRGKIYPNTYIGALNFGSKTDQEAHDLLRDTIDHFPKTIPITIDGKPTDSKVETKDIALEYDTGTTVKQLVNVGREGSLLRNLQQLAFAFFARNTVKPMYAFDSAPLSERLNQIADKTGKQAKDAQIVLGNDGGLTVTPAEAGFGVRPADLESNLRSHLDQLEARIEGLSTPLTPKVTEDQTTYALNQVKTLLAKAPITLTAQDTNATVDAKLLFSWLAYDLKPRFEVITPTPVPSASPPQNVTWRIPSAVAQNEANDILVARIDTDKVKTYLKDFAPGVNREAQNAVLQAVNGTIKVTKSDQDGRKLKIDEASEIIAQSLLSPDEGTTIKLPVEVTPATVKATNIEELGIKELIGRAETSFRGSPENRIHNITTGANFLNGALVPPGEEFSTIKTLGTIDGSTGYLPELVIKENKTTPEFGGGLCQVSTTLFRSVLNAGLKVTERQNHSYRVSYYEPPVGLDATIYFPKPDFKFLNDTPGYILIQNKVEGTKITFELYGTKDGRVATVSDPIVTDITTPPEPQYIDTDTLPKGETKQVEKAHPGATAVAVYTVTRDGKEINKQTFRSKYKAWQARYLVGTKE